MAELLAVPLKKPSDVDVIKPLKNLISSTYSTSDEPQDYSEAIGEFSKLRNTALWKAFEKYESSLEIIYNYYDQICAMESKIPSHEIQIPFKWKDAFDKGTFFGGRMSLTVSSLAYEKVCVLFNIAALQSNVAASQSIETDDGRKLAAKLFQQAAGIFNHLKGAVVSAIQQDPTPDLNPETLSALSALMLAQAQEIFVQKAIQERMKEPVVAKLSAYCEELYAEVLKQLQKESLRPLWDKEWVPLVAGKQAAYHGIAQYYQSLVCKSNQSIGEEIARLQFAIELFKAAQVRSGRPTLFQDFASKVQRELTDCCKDNDFIYHERVPDQKTLVAVGKAPLAKALPIPEKMGQNSKDLFELLVPVAVHQAMATYGVRKTEVVNTEIMRLREGTQLLNSILASLNLPAALEDTSGSSLPQSLQDKAGAVKANGGIQHLGNMLVELPELLQRNKDILDESDRMLQEEKSSDAQLRDQFKEKWTRTPSDNLTKTFRDNVDKYRTIISNAIDADKKVQAKFEIHREGIAMLSGGPEQLQSSVPASGASAACNSSAAQKLRKLMEKVETMKAERDVMESELNSATTDMQTTFLQALAQDGAVNEQAISVESLGRVYGSLQRQAQDSLIRQEALVAEIQRVNAEFCKEKSGSAAGQHREDMLKKLAAAHDAFMELQGNLKEGSKFYNDLTQLLVTFQNKISDYCFARKTEKDELMKDLTQNASRQTAPLSTPSLPQHHADVQQLPKSGAPAPPLNNLPYPTQPGNMPQPFANPGMAPYPAYAPMPSGYNPYGVPQAPYPQQAPAFGYPYAPPTQGTYPQGSYPGYPNYAPPPQNPQQPPPSW